MRSVLLALLLGSSVALAEEAAAPFDAEMAKAQEAYLTGDYVTAAAAYEAALKLQPKNKTAKQGYAASRGYLMRAEAQELAKAGKYAEALALLKKSKKVDPAGATFADENITWVKKVQAAKTADGKYVGMKQAFEAGNQYLAEGQAAQAEAAYRAALAFDAKQPAIHQGVGNALAMQSKYADADAAYRIALELEPKNAALHYCLGVALAGQGRGEDAEKAYARAIELDPKYILAHNNLATLLRARGQLDEAEKHYRAALQIAPGDAVLQQNLDLLQQEREKKP